MNIMLEEVKEVNWNEDILKKYDIKSIQSISDTNLDERLNNEPSKMEAQKLVNNLMLIDKFILQPMASVNVAV